MAVNYYSLGRDKRLCDVVFAGSHDAGIYKGGAPTRAQRDSIAVQAGHGARFFDVRVGAFKTLNKVNMKTFHADDKLQLNRRMDVKVNLPGGKQNMKIMALPVGGHAGEGLQSILAGAKAFVDGSTEFVVLIFSKSTNMDLVVSEVDVILGAHQFATDGPLNTRTLGELQGHVVCVYTEDEDLTLQLASYQHHAGATGRRFGMKNLFKEGGGYVAGYNGIQYYGKGGLTRDVSGTKNKVDRNAALQKEKMVAGGGVAGCEELLGMVYVTATGGIGSLKDRDKKLWKSKRINPLLNIWESDDVADNVVVRLPNNVDPSAESSSALVKSFFPNIVMMDFTDRQRCETIFNINKQSPGPLGQERALLRTGSQAATQALAARQVI